MIKEHLVAQKAQRDDHESGQLTETKPQQHLGCPIGCPSVKYRQEVICESSGAHSYGEFAKRKPSKSGKYQQETNQSDQLFYPAEQLKMMETQL